MTEVRAIGILSAGKMGAATYGIFGLLYGIVITGFTLLAMAMAGAGRRGGGMGIELVFTFGAIIIMPILGAISGFIGGVISALIYNLCAGFMGGIELDLSTGGGGGGRRKKKYRDEDEW